MATNKDDASTALPPLTSCCEARFLRGHGLVPVHGPGVGDPLLLPLLPSGASSSQEDLVSEPESHLSTLLLKPMHIQLPIAFRLQPNSSSGLTGPASSVPWRHLRPPSSFPSVLPPRQPLWVP